MKKTILVWATVMAAGMLALSGCGKKETGQAGEYTNLADKESRKAVVGEEEHEEKIQEAWNERDIQISGDKLSLISVYLHAPEDQARFVGHTGVLAETKEGLLFVEKYSALAPFQATYFKDWAELKDYLLARPDLYGDETELDPIVMENGTVMK